MAMPGLSYSPNFSASQPSYYNSYPPQQMPQPITCRPVMSREEAAAAQVPFDGSPHVFLNLPAGEVYVKQFDFNTGMTGFNTFTKQAPAPPPNYVTHEELARLSDEIERLRGILIESTTPDNAERPARRKPTPVAAADVSKRPTGGAGA